MAGGRRLNPYWLGPSIAIAVPLGLGPLGAWLELLRPDTGLFLFGTGIFLAFAFTAALAAASAYATALARPWRGFALRAAVLPVGVVLGALGFVRLSGAPLSNDISTDLEERPAFARDGSADGARAELIAARLEHFAQLQRESYPDLAPAILAGPPQAAFEQALAVARGMPRWKVVRADPEALQIEAEATTRVFRFVDDVVIRVRPEGSGSRVDVRSRSRMGGSDFGANARRIRAFLRTLRAAAA